MFSSLTGRRIQGHEIGAQYWVDNLTAPVRFQDALVDTIIDLDETARVDALVEIGPHPALKSSAAQTMKHIGFELPYLSTLSRGKHDFSALLDTAGQLYTLGYPLGLDKILYAAIKPQASVQTSMPSRLTDFPNYAWDHGHYWHQSRVTRASFHRPYQHHLLGASTGFSTTFCKSWRNFLRLRDLPWLSDHQVQNSVVFPAAGFISIAVEAVLREHGQKQDFHELALENVQIHLPLTIPDSERGIEVIFQLVRHSDAPRNGDLAFDFSFSSFPSSEEESKEHCSGHIAILVEPGSLLVKASALNLSVQAQTFDHTLSNTQLYGHFATVGIQYGREFRLVEGEVKYSPGFARALVRFEPAPFLAADQENSFIHPAFLDAVLHPLLAATASEDGRLSLDPAVPSSFGSIHFSKLLFTELRATPCSLLPVSAMARIFDERTSRADLAVSTPGGAPMISIHDLELHKFGARPITQNSRETFYKIRWRPAFSYLGKTSITLPKSIPEAIDLFCHQFPKARILLVSDQALSDLQILLKLIGGSKPEHRRFSKLSIHGCDSSFELPDDLGIMVDTNTCQGQVYDIAVVLSQNHHPFHSFVKENGYLLTNIDLSDSVSEHSAHFARFFSTIDYQCFVRNPAAGPCTPQTSKVCLVYSSGQDDVLRAIMDCFQEHQIQFETLEFASISADTHLSSKNVVMLSSLYEDLLWQKPFSDDYLLLRQEFSAIKRLVLREHQRLTWVLSGASLGRISAAQALIIGLLRTARNENPTSHITALDIPSNGEMTRILSHWLPAVLSSRHYEDELVLQESLQIPRLEPARLGYEPSCGMHSTRDRCVLLVGGFSGLGIYAARLLARQGFRHLVFFSRSGLSTRASYTLIEDLRQSGTKVDVIQGDVADMDAVKACIKPIEDRLCGVLHMAMVLKDSPLSTMSSIMWYESIAPKARGAYNLGNATDHLKLDFFICFSSTSGIIGTRGQANYAAANCYLDSYMLSRRIRGLPGTSLNIGMVTDTGVVAENAALQNKMRLLGFDPVGIHDVLTQLAAALATGKSLVTSDAEGFEHHRTISGVSINSQRFFAYERSIVQRVASMLDNKKSKTIVDNEKEGATKIADIEDNATRERAISSFLLKTLSSFSGVPVECLEPSRSMVSYGVDSITAQDIKSAIRKVIGVDISLFDVLGSLTISDIGTKLSGLGSKNKRTKPSRSDVTNPNLLSIGSLHRGRHVKTVISSDRRYEPSPLSPYQRVACVELEHEAIVTSFKLSGTIKSVTMFAALVELVNRNEILRTSFDLSNRTQRVLPTGLIPYSRLWTYEDESDIRTQEFERYVVDHMQHLEAWASELDGGIATRLVLLKESPFSSILLVATHVLITDANTPLKLVDQLTQIYDCIDREQDLEAVPLPDMQHIDFSRWYEEYLDASYSDMDFWRTYLLRFLNRPPILEHMPKQASSHSMEWWLKSAHLSSTKAARLKRIAADLGADEETFLRAVLGFFLAQVSAVNDLLIFVPDTKQPATSKEAIGFFYNLLPVRCFGSRIGTLEELIVKSKQEKETVVDHHGIALAKIVEQLSDSVIAPGGTSFSYRSYQGVSERFSVSYPRAAVTSGHSYSALQTRPYTDPQPTDFCFDVEETRTGELGIQLTYRADMYLDFGAQALLDGFKKALRSAIEDPRQQLYELRQKCAMSFD
jgi:NADP-dependent 3-hydroxy acid dehydrogenase YdfG